jgi:cell wall-associated NlpC family hydrolase
MRWLTGKIEQSIQNDGPTEIMKKNCLSITVIIACLLIISCGVRSAKVKPVPVMPQKRTLAVMGHTIQAGAFVNVVNAVHLTERLKEQGLDATYFKAADGFFKVRFGNFTSKDQAAQKAQNLQKAGIIQEYYIVLPEDYAVARQKQYGTDYLRQELIKTARGFLGVPYLWGGSSVAAGFDCSGLTMTVYQLNGLNLPRHSANQYDAGEYVDREKLQKGDLVFFSFTNRHKISHVGVYLGEGQFIHAPSRGKKIRIDSLSSPYYSAGYIGARNYL